MSGPRCALGWGYRLGRGGRSIDRMFDRRPLSGTPVPGTAGVCATWLDAPLCGCSVWASSVSLEIAVVPLSRPRPCLPLPLAEPASSPAPPVSGPSAHPVTVRSSVGAGTDQAQEISQQASAPEFVRTPDARFEALAGSTSRRATWTSTDFVCAMSTRARPRTARCRCCAASPRGASYTATRFPDEWLQDGVASHPT